MVESQGSELQQPPNNRQAKQSRLFCRDGAICTRPKTLNFFRFFEWLELGQTETSSNTQLHVYIEIGLDWKQKKCSHFPTLTGARVN